MIPILNSPDCRDTNHHKCDRLAWDEQHDSLGMCECACHFGLNGDTK